MSTTEPKPALYALTPEAHATVLAALRFYANSFIGCSETPEIVRDIASNGGAFKPLHTREIATLYEEINHAGLEFGEIVNLIGDDDSDPLVAAAQQHYLLDEGTLEVDAKTIVSRGDDNGAYVMAWLWVDGDEKENQQ